MQSLRHARAIGADAFFSGGGGDDVFCYLRTVLPAIDRLRIEGFRAMLETTGDIARMTHANIWDALLKVTRRAIRSEERRVGKAGVSTLTSRWCRNKQQK